MSRIFISYRRADSIAITGRIYDYLVLVLGEDSIFKDVDDIPLGADFRAVLEREVGSCDALLVVIGPQWANVAFKDGRKRLHDPGDFVRIEVETGLKRGDILVVPVLVDEASMPPADDLPDTLHELRYRNAAIVRHDPDFRRDMERLSKQLQRYFEGSGEVTKYLSQLDALPEDVAWAEIEALLDQAQTAADGDETLTDKISARRQYRVGHREQHIAALLQEAEALLTAEPPDVEQALTILDNVQALAIHESHFSEARNHLLQIVDEVRAREQTLVHERRRQKLEALLTEVETLIQQDPPDLPKIETLLEDIRTAASHDDTLVNDHTVEVRWSEAVQKVDQWRETLDSRQRAQLEAQRRQKAEALLSEAETLMQLEPPDIRQAEALLVAFQAENISDEALETRRRTIRQAIVAWRDADSAHRKAEADEERRRQQEAKRYAQQNFSQSVNRMDIHDAEARRLSEPPPAPYREQRVSISWSRGLIVVVPLIVTVIVVLLYSSAGRGALACPTPTPTRTPTPTPLPLPNLVAGNIYLEPATPQCMEAFIVYVDIANIGELETPFSIQVTVQDLSGPNNVANGRGSVEILNMPPGDRRTIGVAMTVSAYFDEVHTLVATIDLDARIPESNELDNSSRITYTLGRGDCLTDSDNSAATLEVEAQATAAVTAEASAPTATQAVHPMFQITSHSTPTLVAMSRVQVFSLSGNANVRAGDSTQYPVIAQLRERDLARVIAISSRNTNWFLVVLNDGTYGWVSSSAVVTQGDIPILPRVAPPSL